MKKLLLLSLALITFSNSNACLWDKDTYAMEKRQFPTIKELISGQFLRHSPEFHQWRIKDREALIQKHPDSLSLYDDLAVSYCKLDNNSKAIEVAMKKEALQPGLYETYANLGTFYLHDKQLKKGIEYIKKALVINPEAHFGRERYQLYLAEYLQFKMEDGTLPQPLANRRGHDERQRTRFTNFLATKLDENKPIDAQKGRLNEKEIARAINGIKGMMKFGNYDSPILLEVLADLLSYSYDDRSPKQLSVMAMLRACEKLSTESRQSYFYSIGLIVEMQVIEGIKTGDQNAKIYYIDDILTKEISKGNMMYESIRSNEMHWIATGLNPEVEFQKKYYSFK